MTLSTLEEPTSFNAIKELYRNNTEPISLDGMFNGSFKDDNYYRTFTEDAKRTEHEVFYAEEKYAWESDKKAGCFQEKMNKILVGIYLVWNDEKYDILFPKIKHLLNAKADINTTWGGGLFSQTLIKRVFYSNHFKLRSALIDLADPETLEPRTGQSLFSLACQRTDYKTMLLLLQKNCEPNRIEENGTTPLMALCMHWTHRDEDIGYVEQLKCIKLLLTFEGPDAKKLKTKWAKEWEAVCPVNLGPVWSEIADLLIPNINVLPASKGKTAEDHLRSWRNDYSFMTQGIALLGDLFKDVLHHKPYWPRDREAYKQTFNSNWE